MNPSITLGRVAGVRVGVNWSWLIVLALIVWTLTDGVFPAEVKGLGHGTYLGMAIVAALLFFSSLLLHELGHALQARHEGVEIEGITLWLFGGVARFRGQFPSAGAEFRIAIAGPLVTALLGGVFVGVAVIGGLGRPVDGVAAWLGYINFALLAFNLLPAFPLDGGRLLRSLLWRRRGDFRRATVIATGVGRAFGYLLVTLGLLLLIFQGVWSGIWLAFVGWFLLQAAAAEGRSSLLRDALGHLCVRDVMVTQPVTVDARESVADFLDSVAHAYRYTTYPVVEDGVVVGLLPFARIAHVPRADWDSTTVARCTIPIADLPRVDADDALLDASTELAAPGGSGRTLVWSGSQVVGLLSISDLGRVAAGSDKQH